MIFFSQLSDIWIYFLKITICCQSLRGKERGVIVSLLYSDRWSTSCSDIQNDSINNKAICWITEPTDWFINHRMWPIISIFFFLHTEAERLVEYQKQAVFNNSDILPYSTGSSWVLFHTSNALSHKATDLPQTVSKSYPCKMKLLSRCKLQTHVTNILLQEEPAVVRCWLSKTDLCA